MIGRKNKPSMVEHKRSIYKHHLEPVFGRMQLDEIKVGRWRAFRANLIKKGLKDKSVRVRRLSRTTWWSVVSSGRRR